jgi:hypothetical protein
LLERKIALATEGFTTNKFCELVLTDRNRLSKDNALTLCEYNLQLQQQQEEYDVNKDPQAKF